MIKTVKTDSNKVVQRKKGWMWFAAVLALQLVFMTIGYLLQA